MKHIAFLFPGQGSQSVGMGYDLHQEYDVVREIFDMAEDLTKVHLRRLCFKGPMEVLTQTVNLQPALTAVNLSFLAVLRKEGVTADVSAGHSLGEYSALVAADVISGADAIRLVFKRGELMHREAEKHRGAMSAVIGLRIDAVEALLKQAREKVDGPVGVANHNTETQIVVSGAPAAVAAVAALASEKGARAIPLRVSGAWHSELIKGAEADFEAFVAGVPFAAPHTEVIHNVTAEPASDPDEIRTLMTRQLCSPVRWYDAMRRLAGEDIPVVVEAGPGKVLTGLLNKILPKDSSCRRYVVNDLKSLEAFLEDTN
jgi:[acyl-carrier-protein] S-malonyltransferase